MVDLYMWLYYPSACGAQLIRFSYKNGTTYKQCHLTPQLPVNNTCGSMMN